MIIPMPIGRLLKFFLRISPETRFRLVQGFYNLFLGVWVGAMVMLAVSAAITFRTVREFKPMIMAAPYDKGALDDQASKIIAGGIVGNVLGGLAWISGVCAGVVCVCLVLQYSCFRDRLEQRGNSWLAATRVVLLVLPMAVFVWDVAYLSPAIHGMRAVMYNPAERAMDRDIAHARFDKLHVLSERVVGLSVLMLAAAGLMSPFAFVSGNEGRKLDGAVEASV
jgi:hypothetical protein